MLGEPDPASEDAYPPANAALSYDCSVEQGFDFNKNAHTVSGFINSLKIRDREILADLSVTDPTDPSGDRILVFGVLSATYWDGGYGDPISLSAQVSADNRAILAEMARQTLGATEVEIEWTVYDHDGAAGVFFEAFHTNDRKLDGLIATTGGKTELRVAADPSEEVWMPMNFSFHIQVMPTEERAQWVYVATSAGEQLERKWGTDTVY